MNWIPVESSTIACIGFEPEAEYPLGVWFRPNKKQAAAGQQGSVYEYANVSPEVFRAFLTADSDPAYDNSIGKFFERVIKAYPETYPYRKLEQPVDLGPVTSAVDEL